MPREVEQRSRFIPIFFLQLQRLLHGKQLCLDFRACQVSTSRRLPFVNVDPLSQLLFDGTAVAHAGKRARVCVLAVGDEQGPAMLGSEYLELTSGRAFDVPLLGHHGSAEHCERHVE